MTPYDSFPGPRGRLYRVTPHFLARWDARTSLLHRDIPGAVLTARVFAVARDGKEALYAPAEDRVFVAATSRHGPWWVLVTVLFPPDPALRHLHTRGTRAWAFWRMIERNRDRQHAAGAA